MAYSDYEESVEAGQPVQLFLFRYGSDPLEYLAYTDHDEELTVSSITYAPVAVSREDIEADGTLDRASLKIRMDVGTDLAELFRVYPPSSVVTLVIAEGHIGDPDEQFLVTWAGRVVSASRDHSELLLTGEPVTTSMRRPGLRRHYQLACMHQLYGPQCQADKPSKTVATTVSSIAGATVTLASGWKGALSAIASEKWLGGMLEWIGPGGSTVRRTILRVTGDTFMLSGIPQHLAASDAIDVVLGCNHLAYAEEGGDCLPLHNNILNFGGCRWIPLKNPIGAYNNYY
jgi:hypothetical protein